jgi:hypothetical protein
MIKTQNHKVHTNKEYHSVCPLVGSGTLPPPLSPASMPLPPEPKGGGWSHSRAGEGLGESQSNDWRKSLALYLLCAQNPGRRVLSIVSFATPRLSYVTVTHTHTECDIGKSTKLRNPILLPNWPQNGGATFHAFAERLSLQKDALSS